MARYVHSGSRPARSLMVGVGTAERRDQLACTHVGEADRTGIGFSPGRRWQHEACELVDLIEAKAARTLTGTLVVYHGRSRLWLSRRLSGRGRQAYVSGGAAHGLEQVAAGGRRAHAVVQDSLNAKEVLARQGLQTARCHTLDGCQGGQEGRELSLRRARLLGQAACATTCFILKDKAWRTPCRHGSRRNFINCVTASSEAGVKRRMPPLQAAGLKSAPSPPEPNVVCPNGPKELCRGLFVCVPL